MENYRDDHTQPSRQGTTKKGVASHILPGYLTFMSVYYNSSPGDGSQASSFNEIGSCYCPGRCVDCSWHEEHLSLTEGPLSLRKVGPCSGPPCLGVCQPTFQSEDCLTVV